MCGTSRHYQKCPLLTIPEYFETKLCKVCVKIRVIRALFKRGIHMYVLSSSLKPETIIRNDPATWQYLVATLSRRKKGTWKEAAQLSGHFSVMKHRQFFNIIITHYNYKRVFPNGWTPLPIPHPPPHRSVSVILLMAKGFR